MRITHAAQPDFDAARLEILRRRVLWFAYTVGVALIGMSLLAQFVVHHAGGRTRIVGLGPGVGGVMLLIMATFKLRRLRHGMSMQTLIRRTTAVMIVAIVMQIPAAKVVSDALEQIISRATGWQRVDIGALVPLLVSMLFIHLAASIILPWSLWESARPVLIIMFIATLLAPFAPDTWPARIGGILVLGLIGLPGMLLCWLRFSRFREVVELRFLNTRYAEVQRELQYARRIHEKLFPTPISTGPVQFGFRYEPMSQIGGDFVDVIRPDESDDGALTIVLVDVTGHGIVAALAVNRLHGEIKRTLATRRAARSDDDPLNAPSSIISSLNEYVHLTLAEEAVFGTALAVTIDAKQRKLSWVNAGHPPAFLCRANGQIQLLDSTSMMLGPLGNEDLDSQPRMIDFDDGDVLIAYTDGAIECRGKSQDMLGIDGLRAVIENARHKPVEPMLDAIMSAIATFRAGTADDDTLVLAVSLTPTGVKTATTRALAAS